MAVRPETALLTCPSAIVLERGYQVPVWLAEPYMRAQIKRKEEAAISLLLEIETNNTRFYETSAEAATIFDHDTVRALLPLLLEFANNRFSFTKVHCRASFHGS